MTALLRPLGAALVLISAAALAAPQQDETQSGTAETEYQLTLEQMRTFTEVFARIKQDYVEQVDDKTLLQSAIRGMLSDLDPHTAYLDDLEYQQLEENTTGSFDGIGIEVVKSNGDIRIVSPIDGTPAAEAGIKPGDIIRSIDGKSTEDMSLEDAVKLMRGEPGSEVKLTLMREGEEELIELTLERAVVHVESVNARMLEPGYGYLRITAFQNDTPESTREAIERLVEENGGSLRGLVLDLRNNPGGVLNSAVTVADLFLEEGLIVYTKGRSDDARLRYSADTDAMAGDTPIVVLINEGTASASEIVAGALQDHSRAVLVGERSFGKGSVQTVLPLNSGSAVKLTTARYFTPKGRSIQARGIRPDIRVAEGSFTESGDADRPRRREADLTGHLAAEPVSEEGQASAAAELAANDFQLYQALNVLKGANILSRRDDD